MRKSPSFKQPLICKQCGVSCQKTGSFQVYCPACAAQRDKDRKLAFYHKKFPNSKPKTKCQDVCCVCGSPFSSHYDGKPYCNKHYQRLISNGTTELVGRKKTNFYTVENGIATVHMKNGKSFILDESDLDLIRPYGCCISKTGYAVARIEGKVQKIHRFILNAPAGAVVDHINGDHLDNRRNNLRLCTPIENARNAGVAKNSSTGFTGIRRTKSGKFNVRIMVNRKTIHLGNFYNLDIAIAVRKAAELHYFGEYSPAASRG